MTKDERERVEIVGVPAPDGHGHELAGVVSSYCTFQQAGDTNEQNLTEISWRGAYIQSTSNRAPNA